MQVLLDPIYVNIFLGLNSKVICLDNLSTGKYKNIEEFLDNNNFKFIEGDIRDLQTCINSTIDCDYVLHQAALGSVPRSISDAIESNDVNIGGFLNILMACKENNIKE